MTLSAFTRATKHLLNMISSVYISLIVSRLIGRLWPGAQLPAFLVVSVGFILTGIAVILRENRGGEDSTTSMVIGAIPVLIIGAAFVIALGKLTAPFWSDDPGLAVMSAVIFCLVGVGTVIRDAVNKRRLDADLNRKVETPKSSRII